MVYRRLPDGTIQIGAGHHRVEAALEGGITFADLYVAEDLDDNDMVRIYTRENATQRVNSGTALAGSVAAALKLIAKHVLTGNTSRILEVSERAEKIMEGQLKAGEYEVGEPLITRYFHEQGVSVMGQYTVQQQLANLKASGAYARIIGEVEAEIESEREAAREAAALRLLAKAAMTGNLSRILGRLSERGVQTIEGHLIKGEGEGVGVPLIVRYFHEQHVTGMGQYTVEQQLANLKASGDYARLIGVVEDEIMRDPPM
jgi:hypothetical protein